MSFSIETIEPMYLTWQEEFQRICQLRVALSKIMEMDE